MKEQTFTETKETFEAKTQPELLAAESSLIERRERERKIE